MKEEELVKKLLEISGFKELNPVQREALKKGLLKGKNLVIFAPTASGKTFCAELAAIKTILEKKEKVVYMVPLVALANEKYQEFKRKYSQLGIKIALSVGDYDSSDPWLKNYDLIIVSNEKMDSLIRHGAEWISDIGLIVADEIHLLDQADRGPTLEITLTLLRKLVPSAQLLALSATIKNARELAKWLNAETVISEWRPVKLYKGVSYPYQIKFLDKDGYELDSILPLEGSIVKNTLNLRKQALFFVATRKSAESLAEKLGKVVKQYLLKNEAKELEKLASEIENVLEVPTQQCKRIAKCIRLGSAFHHAGLCLPYDARVQLADGRLVEIGKLVKECPKGVEVLSLNPKTLCFDPRRIKNYIKLPSPSEMIKITTRSKKNIIVTLNHPFLTIENGKLVWKKASFLKVNDYIAAPRIVKSKSTSKLDFFELLPDNVYVLNCSSFIRKLLNRFNKRKLISFLRKYNLNLNAILKRKSIKLELLKKLATETQISSRLLQKKVKYVTLRGSHGKCIKVPNYVTNEFLEFLGLIASDGHLHSNGITFVSDPLVFKKISRIVFNLFLIKPTIDKIEKGLVYARINSTILSHILANHFGLKIGRKSDVIHVPEIAMKLPPTSVASFLRGCFEGDSGASLRDLKKGGSAIEFTTASRIFAYDLISLLLRFGITASLGTKLPKESYLKNGKVIHSGKLYRVFISNKSNLMKFCKIIGYLSKSKNSSLTAYLDNVPESLKTYKYDVIPQIGSILKKIRERAKLSFSQIQEFYPATTWWRIEKNRNPITRQNLKKLVKSLESLKLNSIRKELSFLKKLSSSELIWEKITKIEKIKSKDPYVYDLSIKGSHNFIANNIVVHNTYKQKMLIEENFRNGLIKVIVATPSLAYGVNLPAFRVVMRDLKRYIAGIGAVFVPVLDVQQMLGRAGRPQYDSFGEGIILAKSEEEADEIINHYFYGELEEITSKLAVEPVLRMHTLALIASEFCKSEKTLLEFFSKTFYAFQYSKISAIEEKILDILENLIKWKFVEKKKDKLSATRMGRRVSELYIDPLTAHSFIECLTKATKKEVQPFSFLQAISNTIEMQPLLNIRTGEFSELNEVIAKREGIFLQKIPEEWDVEFDEFLRSVKTALMFEAWINEATEDYILNKFKVAPGEFYGRREIADWLIYSLHELALLLGYKELLKHIRKLRVRLEYGVKEELIPLVRLKQIGRIRSRKLYNANLKTLADLRRISLENLSQIVGPKVAYLIKEQLGQVPKKTKVEKQSTLK